MSLQKARNASANSKAWVACALARPRPPGRGCGPGSRAAAEPWLVDVAARHLADHGGCVRIVTE
jgi:hypothetical protein